MIKHFCDKCGCETKHYNFISINPIGIGFPVGERAMKNLMAEPHENFSLCDKCTQELIDSMKNSEVSDD